MQIHREWYFNHVTIKYFCKANTIMSQTQPKTYVINKSTSIGLWYMFCIRNSKYRSHIIYYITCYNISFWFTVKHIWLIDQKNWAKGIDEIYHDLYDFSLPVLCYVMFCLYGFYYLECSRYIMIPTIFLSGCGVLFYTCSSIEMGDPVV